MPLDSLPLPRPRRRSVLSALTVVATTASILAVAVVTAPPAGAATGFTPGDVVVYRVGDGSAALSSAATAVFLDERTPAGGLKQSVALPTTASGSNKTFTDSGSASSDGEITLSSNGRYLAAYGYNAPVGTAGVASSASTTVPRTVAVAKPDGTVDTTTALTDAQTGNNARSAVTDDAGANVWVAGGAGGVRYAAVGAATSTQVSSTSATTNLRQVGIAGGQLYTSASSNGTTLATVGTGLPTGGGTAAITNINFATGAAPTGPYGYQFLTLGTGTGPDTLYVGDNSGGTVRKYALVSGVWQARGSLTLSGVTGVAANVVNGAVSIYATTAAGLFRAADSSGANGTLTGTVAQIATAATNTAFRGVAFAPGTTIGSGGGTPPPTVGAPTVTTAQPALAAALGDPTSPTLGATLAVGANATSTAGQLTVGASSSNTAVAPNNGLSVTGTGANRTVTVTPGAVGTSTITLTVTAPDGQTGSTAFTYGVSANQGDASDRYLAGAGNASAAVAVGGGYALVGDDESDVIRLYDTANSGLPTRTFDFTGQLPFGNAEVDIEGAARAGNTVYWMGSMSTNSSGNVAPARSTLFATTVSGSGANTTLTYAGANTNLQTDLVDWDENNGHGLGANYFGFDQSVNHAANGNHAVDAFNLEGLEFAAGSTTTAYLAFRAPIVPASNRTRALLVPVTNVTQLVTGNAVHGSFGAPIQWDLGGLGVRDLKANADGTFVVLAGTADATNSSFVLYTWDGDPSDPPLAGQSLPLVPAAPSQGAWEAIVSVPAPLVDGSALQLIQDNGETVWYANGLTSKSGLPVPLQKDLLRTFGYTAPTQLATVTTLAAAPNPALVNQPVTYTATVTATRGAPGGPVSFTDGSTAISGCTAQPLAADGTATCTVGYAAAGSHQVAATYAGTSVYAASTSDPVTETVRTVATSTTLTASSTQVTAGDDVTFTATVTSGSGTPDGRVRFATGSGTVSGCGQVTLDANGVATCTTGFAQPGDRTVTATYLGTAVYAGSASDPVTVSVATPIVPTTTTISVSDATAAIGQPVTYTATVDAASGTPTGTVTFSENGTVVTGCDAATLDARGTATCTTGYAHAGTHRVIAAYAGAAAFGASTSDPVTVTVRPTPVTVTADDQTVTFGSPDPVFTTTVTPAVGFTTAPTCDVDGPHTAVGTYAITCSGGDAGADYTITYVDGTLTVTKAATSVTVTADPASPAAAQPVTFTATVDTAGDSTPTGTVAFRNGTGILAGCGAAVVDGSGTATCTVDAGFLPGSVTVTATYSGSASYQGSADSVTITVGRAASTTTVTVAPATTSVGDAVTFTAQVTGPSGITPTGSVTFRVGGGDVVNCIDVAIDGSGTATCTPTDTYPAGTRQVDAAYSGDDNLMASNGNDSFTVTKATASIDLVVTSAPVAGQTLTFSASVGSGSKGATGTVAFTVTGGAACGPVAIADTGVATCVRSGGLPAGDYTVTAAYSGDDDFTPASASVGLTVDPATSTTTLTADSASPVNGQPVTFTAQVAVELPGSGVPTGTVRFTAGDAALSGCGSVTVTASGTAQCTVAAGFAPGTFTATAAYSGDADFDGSGGSLAVTVAKAAASVSVTADPNPPVTGKATTFRAVVSPVAPGTGTPTGSVTFTVTTGANNTRVACNGGNTVALVNGVASCLVPAGSLATGAAYAAAVAYAGDTRFGAGSGTIALTVTRVDTTTTVTSSVSPSPTGGAVTLKAKVTPVTGTAKPTGTATFTVTGADGTRVACTKSNTVSLSSGAATCAIAAGRLAASNGPYAVTAVYSGSDRNIASRGTFSQQVRLATTKVAVAQSANSTPQGTPATFTATVTPNTIGPAAPTGTVTFTAVDKKGRAVTCAGGGPIAANGTASCTIAGSDLLVANGPYKVTTTYSGDGDYATSKVVVMHKVTRPVS